MKIEKISKLVLLGCVLLIIVCFGAFFGFGYNNPVGDNNEPVLTDVIMILMYFLTVVTAVLTGWSLVSGIINDKDNNPAATTGVPGGKIALCTCGLAVISLVVGWVLGMGETDFTAADGTVTTAGWVTVVDVFMVSMGILLLAAAIAVGISMTGVLTKSASK